MRPICDCESCQELANSSAEGRQFAEDLWEMENGPYRNDINMTLEESYTISDAERNRD